MAEIVRLGSVYFGNEPVTPGSELCNQDFGIGDTCHGKELQWVKDGNLFVADRCVCTHLSWRCLEKKGFLFGALVTIDGIDYLCRSLKVGAKEGDPNEWDALLDKYGTDDDLWHWGSDYFWGQEASLDEVWLRPIRGWVSARHWNSDNASCWSVGISNVNVGFRPVLEPVSLPGPTASMVGSSIKVLGPNGKTIGGRLTGYDDYDLILSDTSRLPRGCDWATREGKQVVIDRRFVTAIGDVQT